MKEILYRSIILIFIIGLGNVMKAFNLFTKEKDFSTIAKIILYITLPSAIITNLNGLRFPPYLILISFVGFFSNWLYIVVSEKMGRNKQEKAFMALNINGYNIGNFALPFIAFFLEGIPILAISLFDAGSAVMVMGGNYAIADNIKNDGGKIKVQSLLKIMITSPAVITYGIMILCSLLSVNLPSIIIDFASIIGGANTFLSMFMIGIILNLTFDKEKIGKLIKYVSIRYIIALAVAILVFFLPFISTEIKQTLVLLLFAPVAGTAPIFTQQLNSDTELSAQLNSLSIVLSIVIMSSLLIIWA